MKVTVIYVSPVSDITHQKNEAVTLAGTTLGDLLEALAEKHGTSFKEAFTDFPTGGMLPGMAALVNGRRLDLNAKLEEGDEVAFVMAIAGGA